jgi:drug/metabolite transporter (DMT)-like permease
MPNAATLARPVSRPLYGILFMCFAGTLFPIMNGLVQVLSPRYTSEQIVWIRTVSHLFFIFAIFAPTHGLIDLIRTTQLKAQIIRSVLLMSSTLCFFNGVKHLPLAHAASISFTAPFMVAVLAWPLLGERVSRKRLAAVTVGFFGVLVVIRPGSDVFQWASLFIVGSATFYALYQIYTRRVAGFDPPATSAVYSALVGTILLAGVAYWRWLPIQSWQDLGLLVSLGVFGGLGHYCVARAMTYAPANVVAPFMYWQMVGSVIIGYLISGNFPDQYVWTGAAIIIGAGIFIAVNETRKQPSPAAEPKS